MGKQTENVIDFITACDTGQGWAVCAQYCDVDASFSSQCDELASMNTVSEYCDWMRDLLKAMPNATFELKSFGYDSARNNVTVYSVFTGTHTHDAGPVEPTGKTFVADYVYAMEFIDGRIRHVTKVWNAPWTLRELGWD
ncbi:MAG: ester cyclase [Pseudomonadota bacterium]